MNQSQNEMLRAIKSDQYVLPIVYQKKHGRLKEFLKTMQLIQKVVRQRCPKKGCREVFMSDHLYILWTNGNVETAEKMVFMYGINSLLHDWWDEVTIILW